MHTQRFLHKWEKLVTYIFALLFFVLGLMYSMLPVSLDCSFLIAPLIFSSAYSTIYAEIVGYARSLEHNDT
jgi:hypothetical protein